MTWEYRVSLHRVVDGDTYDLAVDLGFYLQAILRFRLRGADCPEPRSPGGPAATAFAAAWFAERQGRLYARTYKTDSFGRWLADLYTSTTEDDLAGALREAGHAS